MLHCLYRMCTLSSCEFTQHVAITPLIESLLKKHNSDLEYCRATLKAGASQLVKCFASFQF